MSKELIPADLIKDAQEIQNALLQIKELSDEVKEKKKAIKETKEWADLKNAKERLKQFEKANKELADIKLEIKEIQLALKETKEAAIAAEASKQLKEYKDSIKEVGRHMAERILDKKLAMENDATSDEM